MMNNEAAVHAALDVQVSTSGMAESTDLQALFAQILERTDLKPGTRRVYEKAIRNFITHGLELTPNVLVDYRNSLASRIDISVATKNLYLSALRTVYRRAFELGLLKQDLSKSVRSFRLNQAHKRSPISDDEVRKVFAYLNKKGDKRLLALFNLLFRQGLRQAEVVRLAADDVDYVGQTIRVLGKGRDDKELIPMHPRTATALRAWTEEARIRSGYLFPSRKAAGCHLTVNMLYRMVTEVHEAVGISTNPHGWRKVFTSTLIDSGMNLLSVQRFTRHKSMTMLQVYYDRNDIKKLLPDFYDALNGQFEG
jgi:integrase